VNVDADVWIEAKFKFRIRSVSYVREKNKGWWVTVLGMNWKARDIHRSWSNAFRYHRKNPIAKIAYHSFYEVTPNPFWSAKEWVTSGRKWTYRLIRIVYAVLLYQSLSPMYFRLKKCHGSFDALVNSGYIVSNKSIHIDQQQGGVSWRHGLVHERLTVWEG
jgi:hypothetical protein